MKLVSVIVPAYNVEQYVAQAIQSVLAQTYPYFELLIIDDGSRDRTIDICSSFQDSRILLIRQQNRGLAGARNTGIRHAQGEYLAFLDADDCWLPEKLAKHVQHLESSPHVGVSFSRSAFIDSQGKALGIYQMPKLTGITPSHLLCRNPIGNGSAAVIRRQVLESIKFEQQIDGTSEDCYFDESFRQSEDIECWLRIAVQTSWQIEGIPEALTLYRINEDGLSANIFKQLESWERVVDKARSYAPELLECWEQSARAYQLRYLARRAVRFQAATVAVELVNKALMTDWRIILAEPRRTLLTLTAAYLLCLLPSSIYTLVENLALKITGFSQQLKIGRARTRFLGLSPQSIV